MAEWFNVLVAALIAICTVAGVFAVMRSSIVSLTVGQALMQATLTGISKDVALLTTEAAVNASERNELSRRVSSVEKSLGEHGEQIRVLRTKTHMVSSKLMELDPKWKPYRSEEM